MLPFAHSNYGVDYVFQQDNASIHASRETKAFLQEQQVDTMVWPARSPDCNRIENVWSAMAARVYAHGRHSSTTLVTTGTAGVVACYIASLSDNMDFGNTCPVLWNLSSDATTTALAGGLALPVSAVTLTITADINGTPTAGTGIPPSQSFSRLLVPTYSPNPSADHALAQKKTFRYFERITNKFTVAPGASFTWTVSYGIANPKRLIMQPIITNPTAGATTSDTINLLRSPFSTVPATTSPFAALKNLQITVGNVPIWNNPVSFGYDLFVQEMSKSGVDGGLDDVTSAGLLSQR
ncbi:unnamed protein product [Phytophthora lilii]|uniref:Unnamed protein product n=1 Tax=Phytophthora lilii TaxID=2077276 RepID=A0A9W6XHY8_9STRA|nr:unnamed protein product [Phytophthora lilii]